MSLPLLIDSLIPESKRSAPGKSLRVRLIDALIRGAQSMTVPVSRSANPHLCSTCCRISISKLKKGLYHHRNVEELRRSATACHLCRILASSLPADQDSSLVDNRHRGRPRFERRLCVQLNYSKTSVVTSLLIFDENCSGRIEIFSDIDNPVATVIHGRPMRSHAGCPENFGLIKSWIVDCEDNHPECSGIRELNGLDPLLPTRIIDLGTTGDKTNPRLLLSSGQRGRWVALSHCWGQQQILRLQHASQETLMREIRIDELPKTFQDAIYITRKLNIRYLWIDSLCILQDSRSDWQTESSHMPTIYSDAQLVLAANSTSNSHGGILTSRKAVHCAVDLGQHHQISFRPEVGRQDSDFLETRAWCFQEAFLNVRVLCYHQSYIRFTCGRRTLYEHNYVQFPSLQKQHGMFNPLTGSIAKICNALERSDPLDVSIDDVRIKLYSIWYDYLSEYTGRSLTIASDKLVAISGLARRIGGHVEDLYLAGLWRLTLEHGLLWYSVSRQGLIRPREYRAPSWSWAAVEGEIAYPTYRADKHQSSSIEVFEATTTPSGADPHGQVVAGRLVLRARLKMAVVGKKPTREACPVTGEGLPLTDPTGDETIGDFTFGNFDVTRPDEGDTVWCMEVLEAHGISHSRGLILEATESQPNEYRRIGCFSLCDSSAYNPEWFEDCSKQIVTIV